MELRALSAVNDKILTDTTQALEQKHKARGGRAQGSDARGNYKRWANVAWGVGLNMGP